MKAIYNAVVTRQQRRNAKTKSGERIIDYIKKMAKRLPVLNDKEGHVIDHHSNLRAVYMIDGVAGVNKYLKLCHAVMKRDKGNKLERVLYKIKLWNLKQKGLTFLIARKGCCISGRIGFVIPWRILHGK